MKLKYEISRFRSIINTQVIELDSNKINVVIGTNGSGKSNFLDAIRWFSGENIENIKSQKTEFHPNHSIHNLYLDDPEILYDGELVEYERDTIYKLLKKINITFNCDNLTRHFGKYKDLFYKELNVLENGLTDLASIKKSIVSQFKEYWPTSIFSEELEKNYKYWKFNLSIEETKLEINNSTKKGLTKELKNLLCTAIDTWVQIEDIFKQRPNILFSSNLEKDNNILFEYPIQTVKNSETLDPTFKKILNMLGQNTIIEIEQIIDLSISASNRTLIRSIKDNITRRAKESFKKIFKNFTINVIPEIIIDDQQFQIVIRADEKRHYATSVTKYQSSGFKAFLWLVIMLEVVKNWEKNKFGRVILLVDEPDKSLHIILQYELAKYLKTNFTSKNGLFILLTSHSPFLIPNLKENIYIADMTEKGYTELTKAENINNIRNAGIFPLITLFHMEKIQKEIFSTGENQVRIYYELKMDRSKAIEEALNEIIQNKFEYSIVPINSNERKHIFDIRINDFFSKHIHEMNELHQLLIPDNYKNKKDIFLTEKFVKSLLSDDILENVKRK